MANKWYVYLTNEETKEEVYIEASTKEVLQSKVEKQRNLWQKQKYNRELETLKTEADLLIQQYKEALNAYDTIIELSIGNLTYEDYYKEKDINDGVPTFVFNEEKPNLLDINKRFCVPKENGLIEKFSKKSYKNRILLEQEAYDFYQKCIKEYEKSLEIEKSKYEKLKSQVILENTEFNKDIRFMKERMLNNDPGEVESLVSQFIRRLIYLPDNGNNPFINDDEVEYIPKNSTLVISRKLPKEENLPEYADVKWDSRKNELVMLKWKKKDLSKFHESVVFQIVLKTIRHVFEFLPRSIVERIVFNGWLEHINPRNGRDEVACVISLDVDRDTFMDINLSRVDYRSCIKELRGVISPSFF